MTPIPEATAAARLERLARLLDEACVTAQVDATGLSELLDDGHRMLNELSQALTLAPADHVDPELLAAIAKARRSHQALVGVLRNEMEYLSRELARLSVGAVATSSYVSNVGVALAGPRLDRVG